MTRWNRRLAAAGAGAGILLLLATAGLVIADGGPDQRSSLLLVAGAALLALYVLVDPDAAVALVRRRPGRRGSGAVLLGAAAVGLLVGVNVVVSRATQAVDLTGAGLNTLSPSSALVTGQLGADLVVTGFFRPDERAARQDAEALLDRYQQRSRHVKVRFVDPDQEVALAHSLGVTVSSSIAIQYRSRPPVVLGESQLTEAGVTGAILRLETSRTPTVCWAVGEGERSLRDPNEITGYSAVADLLRTSSYQTQDVVLAAEGVPGACDVLVVLQLGRPLGDAGVRAIHDYLDRGGRLLMAVDPWLDPAVLASANAVLAPYGAAFDGGLVVEPDPAHAAAGDPTIPIVYSFRSSPVIGALAGRDVFLPQATPITGTATAGTTSIDLASTTGDAYEITQQRTSLGRRSGDGSGPFVLLRSIERSRSGATTRIVLAGTSALAENRTMPPAGPGANSDLLLASLDWLSHQDSLIAIGPRPAPAAAPALTGWELRFNDLLTAAVLPLLIAAIGLLVRARRTRAA